VIPASVPRLAAIAVAVAALMVVACTGDLAGSPTPAPGSSGAGVAATAQPLTSFGPPPSPSPPDDTAPLTLDGALLEYLPAEVAGIPVTEDLDIASEALSDPALPRIATAVDAAVAVDAGTGNLVSAWVVRLRRDAFADADYRQWRDAYDEGACAAAGGVVGRAEATIAERTAYVTSCSAGLHTYHVWLEEEGILISASSIGEGRFGEHLLEGLRVPA
jgi:hypothetical protein